jgi:nitrite reductase/ring-hydroxylating ferredoxin subunit
MEIDVGDAAGLAEGTMRAVERDGAKVLLARSGRQCHAVGAICPHAGGPLTEGVPHDVTMLCPCHKAAFGLDTGRFLASPAVVDLRVDAGRLLLGPIGPSSPVQEDADPGRW